MSKIISIGNQKGGVGKSTITSFIANYFHKNFPEKKILVIDADDLQTTLYKIRQTELTNNPDLNSDSLYPLIRMFSKDIPNKIESLKSLFDYIFIDLPGSIKQEGVISTYAVVDHLFIPMSVSKQDLDSTLDFYNLFVNSIVPLREQNGKTTTYSLFFNKIDVQNTEFKDSYSKRHESNYIFMDSYIPNNVIFHRNVSTVTTYENKSYNNYIDFFNEFISIINL